MYRVTAHITPESIANVKNALVQLKEAIFGLQTMGRFVQGEASAIIVPHIKERLKDPANMIVRSDWRSDEAMGFPREHYNPGETNKIARAIDASEPTMNEFGLYVGIGNVSKLNEAQLSEAKESGYSLWAILEFGSGVFSTWKESYPMKNVDVANGVIVRKAFQYFPDRNSSFEGGTWRAVITERTNNPGQFGRNFFLALDGAFYAADREILKSIGGYIIKQVYKLSYKG